MNRITPTMLAEQSFFHGMEEAHLQSITDCSRLEQYDAGSLLLHQGEEADAAHLLLEGSVALELTVPGREPLVVETLAAGELVGASWLLPPARVHFDVRARNDVISLRIATDCLRRAMEQDSSLGYVFCRRFMAVVVRRLQATRLRLMDLYGHPGLFLPEERR